MIPWLPDVLEDAGLRVTVVRGYRTNGRPGDEDYEGTATHHTGATSSARNPHPAAGILTRGRSDLPGPLCHWSLGYNGGVLVHTVGRANHAGKTRRTEHWPAGDGNAKMIGCEVDTNGTQSLHPAQLEALLIGTAAIHEHEGWGADRAYRHQDTSITGKWDLGSLSTHTLRAGIRQVLAMADGPRPARPAVFAPGNPDAGPHGPWPFGANHKLGFNPGDNPTWHDGSRPGEATAVLMWQREISMPPAQQTGRWTAQNDAEMRRKTKNWQRAVGLLPTGFPGMAEWNAGLKR